MSEKQKIIEMKKKYKVVKQGNNYVFLKPAKSELEMMFAEQNRTWKITDRVYSRYVRERVDAPF